jgi:nitroreductase
MDFFEVVHTQRSIRQFKSDPVPPEAIRKMIDAAIRAPSGSNTQPWIWLVIRDPAKRDAIGGAVQRHFFGTRSIEALRREYQQLEDPVSRRMMLSAVGLYETLAEAPVLIIPCLVGFSEADLRAGSSIYGAVQNMMLAARAQGLGTVFTRFNHYIEDTLRAECHLPDDAISTCLIPVGYPDGQRFGPTSRKPPEEVTYWDEWGATSKLFK